MARRSPSPSTTTWTRWSSWRPGTGSCTWSTSDRASKRFSSPTMSGRTEASDERGYDAGREEKACGQEGAAVDTLRSRLAHGQDAVEGCDHLGSRDRSVQRRAGRLVHDPRGICGRIEPADGGLPEGPHGGFRYYRPCRSGQLHAIAGLRVRAAGAGILHDN